MTAATRIKDTESVTGSEFNDRDKSTTTNSTEKQTGRTMEMQNISRITGNHLVTDTCGETIQPTGDQSIVGPTRHHQRAAQLGGIYCNDRSNDDGQLKRGQSKKQVTIETNTGPIMNEESELRRMSHSELDVVNQNVFARNERAKTAGAAIVVTTDLVNNED